MNGFKNCKCECYHTSECERKTAAGTKTIDALLDAIKDSHAVESMPFARSVSGRDWADLLSRLPFDGLHWLPNEIRYGIPETQRTGAAATRAVRDNPLFLYFVRTEDQMPEMLDVFLDFVERQTDRDGYLEPLFRNHRNDAINSVCPTHAQWERLFRLSESTIHHYPMEIDIESSLGQAIFECHPHHAFDCTGLTDAHFLELIEKEPGSFARLPDHLQTLDRFRTAFDRCSGIKRALTKPMLRRILGLPTRTEPEDSDDE